MNMLYLLEGSRKKGYGKQLVGYWEKEMESSGYGIVMTSTQSNEYSQHFYMKLGYQVIGGFILESEPFEIMLSKNCNFIANGIIFNRLIQNLKEEVIGWNPWY